MTVAGDLLAFVDRGPSPFHAVAEMGRRLEEDGFTQLEERDRWTIGAGDRRYVVRDGGSIVAFTVGTQAPADTGFRLIGAHTDSPTFRVRPQPDTVRAGLRLVGVEPYGGALTYTWLDRDLTLAGRVAVDDSGTVRLCDVHLPGAWLRIPSLAIHLSRNLRQEGLRLDPQQHLVPLWGPASGPALVEAIADHVGVAGTAVRAWDLVTADTQPAAVGGAGDGYVFAPRLDNLASCHAATAALRGVDAPRATAVFVANDHEEVGSGSAEGARGSFLEDTLRRIVIGTGGDEQDFARARSRSRLISSDMAHALHPNYSDRHEPGHQPRLGAGPVVKHNANQSYATDAGTAAWFDARCRDVGVSVQHFVTRADLSCGSTIGPLTAARLGISTVDVGNPMLSMHSVREQAAVADIEPLIAALAAHLAAPDD
ncbi:MAG: M18 family aminopeptidase [Nitriliruptorales bacterium]|nr:M18 family aminopeptidase [Nitriliruptorales bacterium]